MGRKQAREPEREAEQEACQWGGRWRAVPGRVLKEEREDGLKHTSRSFYNHCEISGQARQPVKLYFHKPQTATVYQWTLGPEESVMRKEGFLTLGFVRADWQQGESAGPRYGDSFPSGLLIWQD